MLLRRAAARAGGAGRRLLATTPAFQDARAEPSSSSSVTLVALVGAAAAGAGAAYFFRDDPLNPVGELLGGTPRTPALAAVAAPRVAAAAPRASNVPVASAAAAPAQLAHEVAREAEARKLAEAAAERKALALAQRLQAAADNAPAQAHASADTASAAASAAPAPSAAVLSGPEPARTSAPAAAHVAHPAAPAAPAPQEYVVTLPPTLSALLASHEQVTANLRAVLREVDGGLAANVGDLTEPELRARVVRLADELRDRSRLEAVRLAEFLERNERLWLGKLEEFAEAQGAAQAAQAAAQVERLRAQLVEEHESRLSHETQRLRDTFEADVASRERAARQQAEAAAGASAEQRLAVLNDLQAKLAAHDALLQARAAYERASARVHRVALASAALTHALERQGPVTQEVAALQAASAADPVVLKAIAALPKEVHVKLGVPTRYALQGRFAAVAREGRRSALTPEAVSGVSGTLGKAFGQGVASVALPATQAVSFVGNMLSDAAASVQGAASSAAKAVESVVGPAVATVAGFFGRPNAANEAAAALSGLFGGFGSGGSKGEAKLPAAPAPGEADKGTEKTVFEAASAAVSALSSAAAAAAAGASDIKRVGAAFDRIEAAVAAGDLLAAIDLLGDFKQQHVGQGVEDWVRDARARVQADEALRLLQARLGVLGATLY